MIKKLLRGKPLGMRAFFVGLAIVFTLPALAAGCGMLLKPNAYNETPPDTLEGKTLTSCLVNYKLKNKCCLYADEEMKHCTMICAADGNEKFSRQDFNCETHEPEQRNLTNTSQLGI